MPINIFNNTELQLPIRRVTRNSAATSWVQADPGVPTPYQIHRVVLTGGSNSESAGSSNVQIRVRNLVNSTTRTALSFNAFVSGISVYVGEIISADESLQINYVSSLLEYYDRKVSDDQLKQVEKTHKLQRQDQIKQEEIEAKLQKAVKK